MMNKFLELHDSENNLILVNISSIAYIEKDDEDGCRISFIVSGSDDFLVTIDVKESYCTIKDMLC